MEELSAELKSRSHPQRAGEARDSYKQTHKEPEAKLMHSRG